MTEEDFVALLEETRAKYRNLTTWLDALVFSSKLRKRLWEDETRIPVPEQDGTTAAAAPAPALPMPLEEAFKCRVEEVVAAIGMALIFTGIDNKVRQVMALREIDLLMKAVQDLNDQARQRRALPPEQVN